MAQYRVDWRNDTLGGEPAGFTKKFTTTGYSLVVTSDADAPAGKSLVGSVSAVARRALTLDAVDADADRATIKIAALCKLDRNSSDIATSTYHGLAGRVSGATSTETMVVGAFGKTASSAEDTANTIRASRYNAGAFVLVESSAGAWTRDTYYWLEMIASGASFTTNIYAANDPGGTPLASATNSTSVPTGVGGAGLFFFHSEQATVMTVRALIIATGADALDYSWIDFYGTVPAQEWTLDTAITALDVSTYFSATEKPLTYAVQSGALPTGVTLNTSTGVISGTPTAVNGTSPLVIRATDQDSQTADTNSFTFTVTESTVQLALDQLLYTDDAETTLFAGTVDLVVLDRGNPRTVVYEADAVSITGGVLEITNAAFETPDDVFDVVIFAGSGVQGVFQGTVG